jgi:hypothetical protein
MGTGKIMADASMAKISSMENRLTGTLKTVAPRSEFVHILGQRIQAGNRAAFVTNVVNWYILALLIAGFAFLATLLAMVVRAMLALSGKKRTA